MPGFLINGTGGENAPGAKNDINRSYRWKINNLPPISRDYYNLVVDCTLPSIDFDVLTIQGMSLEYKIPKKPVFANMDMTFYDFGSLQDEFEAWIDYIWSPDKGLFDGGNTTNIKHTIKVDLLDNAGEPIRKYEIYGAWPKKLSSSKLSMTDENLKTVIVEFVYDYYYITT